MHRNLVDRVLQAIGRCVFPPLCLVCGADGLHEDLCGGCAADLPRNDTGCGRCGLPLAYAAAACGACLRRQPAFEAAHIPLRYAHPVDALVTRFKFGGDLAAGRVLARCIVRTACGSMKPSAVDLVVPVPLHRRRLRERGYNQAVELARPLASALGCPLSLDALARTKPTSPQTGLAARERRRNVRDAFMAAASVANRRIALVDDVVTTGATVHACAQALRRAGAARVEVYAIARAAEPG